MKPVIYHNPRCAKSRAALRLIEEHGHTPRIVKYLDEPPTPEELDRLCTMLEIEPVDLVRSKERRLKELGVSTEDDRSRAEWLSILSENPILIERPIVVVGDRAIIGRPPERVQEIL